MNMNMDTSIKTAIVDIARGVYSGRKPSPYSFSDDVLWAITEGYAKDADLTWMMSDDGSVRPSARLTDKGIAYGLANELLEVCPHPAHKNQTVVAKGFKCNGWHPVYFECDSDTFKYTSKNGGSVLCTKCHTHKYLHEEARTQMRLNKGMV